MAKPRPGLVQVTIYVPDELHEGLRTKAFFERTSINKLVVQAVQTLLKESPPPKLPKQPRAKGR